MSEILKLEYNASTKGVLMTLDAVEDYTDEKGVKGVRTMAGKPHPVLHFTLDDPKYEAFATAFAQLLPALHDTAREHSKAVVATPDQVREEANKTAREQAELAEARLQHQREAKAHEEQLGKLTAMIEEKSRAAAMLDAEIAGKNREAANRAASETVAKQKA